MDELVKDYLEKAKAAVASEESKKRNKHLISLGLYHTERVYGPYGGKFLLYDKEQKRHYYEKKIPVEVTDEEYAEICKYSSRIVEEDDIPEKVLKTEIDNRAERILGGFNNFMLCATILLVVALIVFAIIIGEKPVWAFALGAILVVAGAVLLWATVKVCLNISNNLHEINAKMPE